MATQTSPAITPSAQVVGNAFVEQYYHILHQSPQLVHRFYTDSSVLSRPGPDGSMTSVKTMQAIDQVILSLDYKDYKAEIRTIDSQESYKAGVVVLVTGWLTVEHNVKRKFAQSFFLAPQDKGYFVLNDVFRFVDEHSSPEPNDVPVDFSESIPQAPITQDPELSPVPDHPVSDNTTPAVDVAYQAEEVHKPSDNGDVSVKEAQVLEAPVHSVEKEVSPAQDVVSSTAQDVVSSTAQDVVSSTAQDVVSSTVQEDAPKKSYASIVKVKATSLPVNTAKKAAAGNAGKVAVVKEEQHSAPASAPVAAASATNSDANSSSISEEVEGYSIYIRGLPLNASVMQVEDEFKKFGEIRANGVQVRSNKQGFCFGFVEYVTAESMQRAIESSPITIEGWEVSMEEKRTRTRVGPTGRPRFPPGGGRPVYRNDNFRGRGNFGGGGRGGYGRNEFVNRGEFSGRRGPVGRIGDGYQRVDHNVGNGRPGRQGGGGMSQTAITA